MSMRIVTPFTIAKLADEKEVKDLQPVLGFGADCYEAGMMEILTEVAERALAEHPAINRSEPAKSYQNNVEYQLLLLKNSLTPDQVKLLEEYDDQYGFLSGAEATDYFIAGFLQGYRYLKSRVAHPSSY
jgi:hypothetical protein